MSEENKALVARYTHDVFDRGDVAAVDGYLSPDFVNHVTGRRGTDDFRRLAAEVGNQPGNANVIELLIAEGDLVAAYMTITRVLDDEFEAFGFRFPGDGRSYTVKHVHIYRVTAGRITEHWAVRDDLDMLRQLGAFAAG
jgi:predicted ester cyclase